MYIARIFHRPYYKVIYVTLRSEIAAERLNYLEVYSQSEVIDREKKKRKTLV